MAADYGWDLATAVYLIIHMHHLLVIIVIITLLLYHRYCHEDGNDAINHLIDSESV